MERNNDNPKTVKPIPLLFLSDSPHLATGLARITKDLAVHCSSLPEFRVGVMGRGGVGSRQLPFAQYNFPPEDQWGEGHIEHVWQDFAGQDQGIIMTIWDLSRLRWFTRPQPANGYSPALYRFLTSKRFKRWGYIPVDGFGVNQQLTGINKDTVLGFDRVLAYSCWGSQVLQNTLGHDVDWIPHGYNEKVFQPRDKTAGRMALNAAYGHSGIGVEDGDFVTGCVMTNQARKDWGLAFSIMAELKPKIHNLKFWAHVDVLNREWNLLALMHDFGLQNQTRITFVGDYSSEQLSYMYSACDLTILPSLGEGFGYPIVESLACGVPVLHGNYAAGVDLIPIREWLIDPIAHRLDGPWNNVRPVYDPRDWVKAIELCRAEYQYTSTREMCIGAVEHLKWSNLWPACWKKFFLEGIQT